MSVRQTPSSVFIEGSAELEYALNRLGRLPIKSLSAAVRAGARVVRQAVKSAAPVRKDKNGKKTGGTLRRAITTKMEKSRKRGKKVVEITYSPKYTDQLAGVSPGTGKRYFYPSSMEYGFTMRNGKHWDGYHFMRDSAKDSEPFFEKAVIERMTLEINKEWAKNNGTK